MLKLIEDILCIIVLILVPCFLCEKFGVYNTAEPWECCEQLKERKVTCDLCNGEGYTEHEYKPRMVQDGWERTSV